MSVPASVLPFDPFANTGDLSQYALTSILPWFNVKDYGAKGDNVTDDAGAIGTAITAASNAGGGLVAFPQASYAISTLTISAANPVILYGPGATLAQLSANALNSTLIVACNNLTIDGLAFTGSITAGHENDDEIACVLLKWTGQNMTGVTIKNCNMSGKSCAIGTYMGAIANTKFTNLTLRNNFIRCLHYGIRIGPYAQNAVVNDTILCEGNDIQVSAIGGYTGFQFARPLQIINTNNLVIRNNKSLGGFSGIETYGGTGVPTRPRQSYVEIVNNITDGHIGFTQVTDGVCSHNVVDLTLRLAASAGNGTWPLYDNATVLAAWSYLCGIEAADITNCTIEGNAVANQVGAGIQYGALDTCVLANNTIVNSGNTASPPAYAHGIWMLNGNNDSSVVGNTIKTCARSGIAQSDITAADFCTNMTITNNVIVNTQEHGIHVRNTNGLTISNNRIKTPNLAAGIFNGIDFTIPFPGTDIVRRMVCSNNYIDGGKFGINQPYFETTEVRGLSFIGNISRSATTSAFNIIGKRRNNTATAANPTLTLATGHMDIRTAIDLVVLDPGGAASFTFIDNGALGDEITIQFARADTVVTNSANLLLNGSANVTPSINSVMTFICISDGTQTAQVWLEKSRMIR